jgi:hypothetical protein
MAAPPRDARALQPAFTRQAPPQLGAWGEVASAAAVAVVLAIAAVVVCLLEGLTALGFADEMSKGCRPEDRVAACGGAGA